ncbi:MAG: hypothetical protein AAB284_05475, partial [Chloroflexota bacterium]
MGLAAKRDLVAALSPDVLIAPESSERDILGDAHASSAFWTGDNVKKGLGVLSFGDVALHRIEPHDRDIRFVMPGSASVWSEKARDLLAGPDVVRNPRSHRPANNQKDA